MTDGSQMTATRVTLGTASFSSCRRLAISSGAWIVRPVMLPPGRPRLATNPGPTGSPTVVMTIGIVRVAS